LILSIQYDSVVEDAGAKVIERLLTGGLPVRIQPEDRLHKAPKFNALQRWLTVNSNLHNLRCLISGAGNRLRCFTDERRT
jgi:hypothetical protein